MASRGAVEQSRPEIRLAELMAALSIATDLGMGQPLEFALSSCVLAMRLGDSLGMTEGQLRDVYYQSLLRYIGCNAETHVMASLFGDELAFRRDYSTVDPGKAPQVLGVVLRYLRQANEGTPPLQLALSVAHGMMTSPRAAREGFAGHCEVAQRLAERFGFGEGIIASLGQLYERWDGKGLPKGLRGEHVAPPVLVVSLAQDAMLFHRLGGVEAAVNVVRERRGTAYDPSMADRFCQEATKLMAGLDEDPSWDSVLALEPGVRTYLSGSQFDEACRAIADFGDIKSPYTLNHSPGVADLARDAALRCGLPDSDAGALWRAGLLHDVGRVGVSAGIWGKPGPLSEREWEKVRMHPYYTERVLARPKALVQLGAIAGLNHERLDGSGYHRGLRAGALSPAARILAAADAYHAMVEPRPHRAALTPDAAAEELHREVRAGRLDGEAASGVLAAAGHRVRSARRDLVAGLSGREMEVLRLLARGRSTRQIAGALVISEKTADNHIQHIYAKIGVSTRAGATLFAMEHDLLSPLEPAEE